MVTIDDVRQLAARLPRAYEAFDLAEGLT